VACSDALSTVTYLGAIVLQLTLLNEFDEPAAVDSLLPAGTAMPALQTSGQPVAGSPPLFKHPSRRGPAKVRAARPPCDFHVLMSSPTCSRRASASPTHVASRRARCCQAQRSESTPATTRRSSSALQATSATN
jgi:hypothetical protein